MIILDTSGLLAAIDAAQPLHARAAATLSESQGPLLLSPFVLAELDYLLGRRVGRQAQQGLLREVAAGAYQLEPFTEADVGQASTIADRYGDLAIGLADASIVVLAGRFQCLDLLSLDERHFRTVLGADDRPFRVLPADA